MLNKNHYKNLAIIIVGVFVEALLLPIDTREIKKWLFFNFMSRSAAKRYNNVLVCLICLKMQGKNT
jgi:hypothetical protein